jgi:hypothetical protein
MKRKWDSPPQPEGSRITEGAFFSPFVFKKKKKKEIRDDGLL